MFFHITPAKDFWPQTEGMTQWWGGHGDWEGWASPEPREIPAVVAAPRHGLWSVTRTGEPTRSGCFQSSLLLLLYT
ncbi:hypothetical protein Taro_027517 [Colocasia esculenta]|uniref:Uncharacterized protein n=1 Tax=Colocasia esculenta TaxID=4460 RepID=A0A843VFY6_COLES|nr:hypothetical protein [Colocasia esculenta]